MFIAIHFFSRSISLTKRIGKGHLSCDKNTLMFAVKERVQMCFTVVTPRDWIAIAFPWQWLGIEFCSVHVIQTVFYCFFSIWNRFFMHLHALATKLLCLSISADNDIIVCRERYHFETKEDEWHKQNQAVVLLIEWESIQRKEKKNWFHDNKH